MPHRDLYAAWKRRRAEAPLPDDFADRVMATLIRREQSLVQRLARMLPSLFRSPAFRVGVCSLACAVGLLRILQVVVVFVAEQASR
jgi:hypothetical protein